LVGRFIAGNKDQQAANTASGDFADYWRFI